MPWAAYLFGGGCGAQRMARWLQSLRHIFVEFFVRFACRRSGGGEGKAAAAVEKDCRVASGAFPGVVLPPPPPSAPAFPDFDFKPSDDFMATMGGEECTFTVANPLDLTLRRRGALMLNVLVVDVGRPAGMATLWFKFDSAALEARGVSVCRLFVDSGEFTGLEGMEFTASLDGSVCGWVIDRKRM